jgi:hypothetical protein
MSLKAEAHAAFDSIWKSGRMSRGQAYLWLERVLGVTRNRAHISKLKPQQLRDLITYSRYVMAQGKGA